MQCSLKNKMNFLPTAIFSKDNFISQFPTTMTFHRETTDEIIVTKI